jgi:hypothetical protein
MNESEEQHRFTLKSRPHSQLLAESRNAPKTTRASRGSYCWPPFCRGLSPVETILGESQGSGRRISLNHDLRNGTLALGRSVEQRGSQDRLPRFRIRACSAPIPLKTIETLNRTPILNAAARSSDWFLASVAVPAHLRRVPSQRLLTSGTSVVLEPSRLSPPEDQVPKQNADARTDGDSD